MPVDDDVSFRLGRNNEGLFIKMACRRGVSKMLLKSKLKKQVQSVEEKSDLLFLDLPELVLENIIRRLSARSVCQLAGTCRDLRKRCRRDEVWEPLFHERWGKVAGSKAFISGHWMLRRENAPALIRPPKPTGAWMRSLACIWPFSRLTGAAESPHPTIKAPTPNEAFVDLYSNLENGKLWFPAQVYNREHGHAGFMLSCYDAELNYDRASDTFCARYLPHCARSVIIEDAVPWERIRKPPIETLANEFYIPDIPEELRPGDHVEVQWKRNQGFPYGWWYGVVGHADSCRRGNRNCKCHLEDVLWLEFRQYARGSRWRRIQIRRKRICEDASEAEGFYGGIRKLHSKDDICAWLQVWPKESLE